MWSCGPRLVRRAKSMDARMNRFCSIVVVVVGTTLVDKRASHQERKYAPMCPSIVRNDIYI